MPPKLKINRHQYDIPDSRVSASFDCEPLFSFRYNLTRNNEYTAGSGAYADGKLHFCTADGELVSLCVAEMEEIEYIQYIGCAAVEYTVGGERCELCRSDMRNAVLLQNTVKRLKAVKNGRSFERIDPETDETCCQKCGTPYRSGSHICPNCADRKRLFGKIMPYAKPYMGWIILSLVMFFAVTGINMISPLVNRRLIDDYLLAPEGANPSGNGFVLTILMMAGLALLLAVIPMLRQIILIKVGNKININLRRTVYEKVQAMSLSGIGKRTAGEIITRITQDTDVMREFLVSTLPDIMYIVLTLVGVSTLMFIMNWKLTLLILIPVPFVMLLFYSLRTFMNSIYSRQWHSESAVNSLLHDVFSGIRVVKVFGTEKNEEKRFNKAAKKVADISQKNEKTWNMIMPFANFLLGIGEYAVLFFVGAKVLKNLMTVGQLQQYMTYVAMIYGPIRYAAFLPRRFARAMTSMAKVFELVDDVPDVQNNETAIARDIDGNVSVEHAYFGYNNYEDILKNITFDIKKGEMVGLVGRSGVGKTTFINLILRLYDVTDGKITIDGIDLRDYDQHSLRSQIGVVLQETYLFKGTIYSNIAYAMPGCTSEDVIRAAKLANAHQFIMKLPDGYNTIVGERGQTLSGGERQRIAIARAVLRNPRILLLDEATASLDTVTEKLIQDALNRLISGRTTVAIAHRLSTLRNATRLVVFEKGEVEEVGTHEELIANKKRYYKLVMAQRQMSKMKK